MLFITLDPANEPAQPVRLATVYNALKIPTSLKNCRIRGTGAQNKVIGLRWPRPESLSLRFSTNGKSGQWPNLKFQHERHSKLLVHLWSHPINYK